jgi:2-polyprenyl-6-hydroxyphenyl methylase/3-demethylubiquinone-9 3-methyltransferase
MTRHGVEVTTGQRFEFGKNWRKFLGGLSEQHIARTESSIKEMLGLVSLKDKTFLDIGSGSGVFKLLGEFDVVYSWGVLHHTGNMRKALRNVIPLVKRGGSLFIAIYNDQGSRSQRWLLVKRLYNRLPSWSRMLVLLPAFLRLWGLTMVRDIAKGKPFRTWTEYKEERGMSPWRDVVDWVGGYPFEVAKPDEIIDFYRVNGFGLVKVKTCGKGHGCNEFVFVKEVSSADTGIS